MGIDVVYLIEKECRRRGYSNKTSQAYCYCARRFMDWVKKEPRRITRKDIQEFTDLLIERNMSGSTINVYVNALKFLISDILSKRILLRIKYSKIPRTLPVVLSQDEMKRLINSIENEKQRLMIALMYSSGLRLSELVHLKVKDLELERNFGWVRNGKGGKDRLFIIARGLNMNLRRHILDNKLTYDSWLFNGRKGRHIHQRTIQEIVKNAAKKANIEKNIHAHTLRHSFATHLIENGYDLMEIQALLGHSSPKTTMVYVHAASPRMISVESPYDKIMN